MTLVSSIKIGVVSTTVVLLMVYGVYQARTLITGPKLQLESPLDGSAFVNPLITIAGNAHNISIITLNDRPISTDQQGNFSEKLLLSPGYTIIKVQASDKFGRETQQLLELTYNPAISQNSSFSKGTDSTSDVIVRY